MLRCLPGQDRPLGLPRRGRKKENSDNKKLCSGHLIIRLTGDMNVSQKINPAYDDHYELTVSSFSGSTGYELEKFI